MAVFSIKQGDLFPVIIATLIDSSGVVDLTDATAVVLELRKRPNGSVVTKNGSFVEPRTSGQVQYAWQAGDTDAIGIYDAQWTVTFDAEKRTFPARGYDVIEIYPDL